ncbi:MAG: TadE/TadG family type IV pilus assembly protein [Lachnospiraceae bacterium]
MDWKNNNKGMMTIEACFLLPLLLMLCLLVIWLGFFLYNKTLFMECAGIAAILGSQMAEADNETIGTTVNNRARELLSGKTVLAEGIEVRVTVDYDAVTVGITGLLRIPGVVFLTDTGLNNTWQLQASQTAGRLRNCSILRGIEHFRKEQDSG